MSTIDDVVIDDIAPDVEDVEDVDKVENVEEFEPLGLQGKADLVHSNTSLVYEAGQKVTVGEDKIINKTASGTGILHLNDVSEIPHYMNVSLSSKNKFDFSVLKNKNLDGIISGTMNIADFPGIPGINAVNAYLYEYDQADTDCTLKTLCPNLEIGKTYTVSAIVEYGYEDNPEYTAYMWLNCGVDWDFGKSVVLTQEMLDSNVCFRGEYIGETEYPTHDCIIANIQIEEGITATEYTPYIDGFSAATVTVCGKNMLNPQKIMLGTKLSYSAAYDGAITYVDDAACICTIPIPINPNCTYSIINKDTDTYWFYRAIEMLPNGNGCKNYAPYANASNNYTVYSFISTEETVAIMIVVTRVDGAEMTEDDISNLPVMLVVAEESIATTPFTAKNPISTPYEPYEGATYTPSADGIVNIKSISPVMNISCDIEGVNISADYNKSYGMQLEHDRFWRSYMQGFETAKQAAYYGAGLCWNDDNFKPPYPLKVSGDHYMAFARAAVSSITEEMIDCSNGTQFSYFGYNNSSLKSAVIDVSSATRIDSMFMADDVLESVTIKNIPETANNTNLLINCKSLKDVHLSGTIGKNNLDLSRSTLLTKESIINVFSVLSDSASGLTLTLSLTAVNTAFETAEGLADGSTSEEWLALVATKTNWSVSLI